MSFPRKWTTLQKFWMDTIWRHVSYVHLIPECYDATKEKQNRRKRKKRAWRLRHWVQLGLFFKKSLKGGFLVGICNKIVSLYYHLCDDHYIHGIIIYFYIFVCLSLFLRRDKEEESDSESESNRALVPPNSLTFWSWCCLDGCDMLGDDATDATTEVVVPVVAVPAALMVERLEASSGSVNRWSCYVFRTVWLILLQHPFVLERCSSNGRSSREASPTFHRKVRSSSEQEVDRCLIRHPNHTFGSFKIP